MADDKTTQSPAQHRATFWTRLKGINAGMLGLRSDQHFQPMSHQITEDDDRALWFITAQGTHLAEAVSRGAQDAMHLVAEGSGKLYARLEGRLELSNDQAKLDEIWSQVSASWFEEGRDDPDVRLLKFTISSGEVWTTTGGLGFLYEVAKARVTGAKPDMGEHFEL
ncbi:general stress protein [Paracoccus sp. S-4012]|uniref:pyridoxamine 5'-phosphate oxidase family protein n=1 Tax=Paracoccus sp. S-4012 TaxID=2665648 RepID=UPI0012B0853A|nr:pyridoxamine 5'-phosphate oxidase family protein [Paracoccus sp. S-4012]MRX51861.1 general stress protein [Paracoccus sp. S-4012]